VTACVLCAARGRDRPLDVGLVCPPCAVRLADTLDDIAALAEAATVEPRSGRGSGRTVPASRPPLDLDGVDPALASVRLAPPPAEPVPLLVVLEGWCRLVREERHLAPYGPATAQRRAAERRPALDGYDDTTATLRAAVGFLRAQHEWVVAQDWVDAYAAEVWACRRAVARWGEHEPRPTVVACPTITVSGECGWRLRLDSDVVRCPGCARDWDAETLVRVACSDAYDPPDVWVDAEAAASAAGVHEATVRRWASRGQVAARAGRYRLLDVLRVTRSA
jgi:hypothetical protein